MYLVSVSEKLVSGPYDMIWSFANAVLVQKQFGVNGGVSGHFD